MDDNFNLMVFSGRDNLPEFLATAKELEVKGLMEANDGPTENEEQESPVKDEDESIGAALEPQMEIRENGSDDDENTNDKLVVNVQGSDWGEEDYSYSGQYQSVWGRRGKKFCSLNFSGSRGGSQPPMDQDCVKPDFKSGSIFNLTTPSKNSGAFFVFYQLLVLYCIFRG